MLRFSVFIHEKIIWLSFSHIFPDILFTYMRIFIPSESENPFSNDMGFFNLTFLTEPLSQSSWHMGGLLLLVLSFLFHKKINK